MKYYKKGLMVMLKFYDEKAENVRVSCLSQIKVQTDLLRWKTNFINRQKRKINKLRNPPPSDDGVEKR